MINPMHAKRRQPVCLARIRKDHTDCSQKLLYATVSLHSIGSNLQTARSTSNLRSNICDKLLRGQASTRKPLQELPNSLSTRPKKNEYTASYLQAEKVLYHPAKVLTQKREISIKSGEKVSRTKMLKQSVIHSYGTTFAGNFSSSKASRVDESKDNQFELSSSRLATEMEINRQSEEKPGGQLGGQSGGQIEEAMQRQAYQKQPKQREQQYEQQQELNQLIKQLRQKEQHAIKQEKHQEQILRMLQSDLKTCRQDISEKEAILLEMAQRNEKLEKDKDEMMREKTQHQEEKKALLQRIQLIQDKLDQMSKQFAGLLSDQCEDGKEKMNGWSSEDREWADRARAYKSELELQRIRRSNLQQQLVIERSNQEIESKRAKQSNEKRMEQFRQQYDRKCKEIREKEELLQRFIQ